MSCLPLNHAFEQPLRHVRQTIGRQKEEIHRKENKTFRQRRERKQPCKIWVNEERYRI
jgi:hypothetical protein